MKLIGSRREQQMREELIRSNLALQEGGYGRLTKALESANVNIARAYVINWIPEQAEEIYVVLVSANEVVNVEVPREGGHVLLDKEGLAKYEAKCSKLQRLKIAVAQDLLARRTPSLSD